MIDVVLIAQTYAHHSWFLYIFVIVASKLIIFDTYNNTRKYSDYL